MDGGAGLAAGGIGVGKGVAHPTRTAATSPISALKHRYVIERTLVWGALFVGSDYGPAWKNNTQCCHCFGDAKLAGYYGRHHILGVGRRFVRGPAQDKQNEPDQGNRNAFTASIPAA